MDNVTANYDESWKEALNEYFDDNTQEFMEGYKYTKNFGEPTKYKLTRPVLSEERDLLQKRVERMLKIDSYLSA
jgi:hypothetical protein